MGRAGGRARVARKREYDEKVVEVMRQVWKTMDYICGKRLRPVLADVLERLEHFGEIACDEQTRFKLGRISAATIDRRLAAERKKYQLKGRSGTRPGSLLKSQIPDADLLGVGWALTGFWRDGSGWARWRIRVGRIYSNT